MTDCVREGKELGRRFSSKGSRVGLLVCCLHPGVVTQACIHRHMLYVVQDRTWDLCSGVLQYFTFGLLEAYMRLNNPRKPACHGHARAGPHCPSWSSLCLPPSDTPEYSAALNSGCRPFCPPCPDDAVWKFRMCEIHPSARQDHEYPTPWCARSLYWWEDPDIGSRGRD